MSVAQLILIIFKYCSPASMKFLNHAKSRRGEREPYQRVPKETKKELIQIVGQNQITLTKAASLLGINLSTAKSIIRNHRRKHHQPSQNQDFLGTLPKSKHFNQKPNRKLKKNPESESFYSKEELLEEEQIDDISKQTEKFRQIQFLKGKTQDAGIQTDEIKPESKLKHTTTENSVQTDKLSEQLDLKGENRQEKIESGLIYQRSNQISENGRGSEAQMFYSFNNNMYGYPYSCVPTSPNGSSYHFNGWGQPSFSWSGRSE